MTLIRVFGKEFIIASGIKLIVDCLQFVEPLLVEKLIMFVRDQTQEIEVGFIISIMFFINALCKEQIRTYRSKLSQQTIWTVLELVGLGYSHLWIGLNDSTSQF